MISNAIMYVTQLHSYPIIYPHIQKHLNPARSCFKYIHLFIRHVCPIRLFDLTVRYAIRLTGAYLFSARPKCSPNTPTESTLKNGRVWGYNII